MGFLDRLRGRAQGGARGGKPRFLKKMRRGKAAYKVYTAADAESARAFLSTKKVERPFYYVEVQTPEGDWGIDKEGLYLVELLPWQADLTLSECEGQICELPPMFNLAMAARGNVDNFVAKVRCGGCGREWMDGLRYQNATVVRCPECRKHNKVDSSSIHVHFANV